MKTSLEIIRPYEEGEILSRGVAVSNGIWMYGMYEDYCFEAKINDHDMVDGINKGRVTHLTVTAAVYLDDNSFHTEIARYCGGWDMRSCNPTDLMAIERLVTILNKTPGRDGRLSK